MSQPEHDPQLALEHFTFGAFILQFTRVWLPVAIAALGVTLIVLGHGSYSELANTHSIESACGVAVVLVALTVWMINWMYRLGVSSNEDRDQEERAREYFDATGRWPEDDAR
jgi:protein-S-isoprenylcysteine O-methyltransferase Ste14